MHLHGIGSKPDTTGSQPEATAMQQDDETATEGPDDRSVRPDGNPVRTAVTTTVAAGVTLVRVVLRNDLDVPLRVRVSNELDGPTLPPRRAGVPAAGWDADGFTGTVPAGDRIGIGYACPAAASGARSAGGVGSDGDAGSDDGSGAAFSESGPVSVDCLGPAGSDSDTAPSDSGRVVAAVRSLGRASPPADAVPVDSATPAGIVVTNRTGEQGRPRGPEADSPGEAAVPPTVESWLAGIETRIDDAEALTDATAAEAAAVLETCGGVDGVASLRGSLADDTAALRAVADRIDELATRAAATDIEPVLSSLAEAASDAERPAEKSAVEPDEAHTATTDPEPSGTAGSHLTETR